MPLWLIPVWRFLKPLLPYIAIVLAVLAAWAWTDARGYQRGFHKRDGEIQNLTVRATEAEASVARLRAAIDDQNAQVAAMRTASDARAKAAQDALGAATAREKATLGTIDRLRASAAVKPSGPPCAVSAALAGIGKEGL